MAKIKTTEVKTEKKKIEFMAIWTGIWIVAMTAVFPVFFRNGYSDILEVKYGFMLIADGAFLAGFIIWALIAGRPKKYIAYMKSHADAETGNWFGNWFKDAFNWLDIFVLAFFVFTVIALLCASPYMYQAFFGNEGRWMGAITLMFLSLTFFVASRYFRSAKGFITVFLIGTLITTIWSITDYFDMDIMGFKYGIVENYNIFTSTFGNIDTYCGFAAIPMAFAGTIFIFSKESIGRKIFYWICYAAALISMVMSAADNAYLAFIIFFAFVPLAATRTKGGIRRYIIAVATFITSLKLVGYFDHKLAGRVMITNNEVVNIAAGLSALTWIAILLWCIAIGLFIYQVLIKKYTDDTPASKEIHTIWLVILIIGIVGSIAVFIYANITAQSQTMPKAMEPLKNFLVVSDEWGSWRGYVWKKVLELYAGLPLINQIFGTGPETAGIYMFNESYFDIAGTTRMLFDTPHNEWLLMFFNIGPFGLISYLGALITPVIMASKRSVKAYYPFAMAVGFVCICHLAECFVNISVPMELPIIFALMAMAQSLFRSKE